MNQVFKYIREYYVKDFNLVYLLLVMAMMGCLIYFNYWHGLEKRYAAGHEERWKNIVGYYFLYAFPFITAFLLQYFFFPATGYFKSGWFWVIVLLSPFFFAFRTNFDYHVPWLLKLFASNDSRIIYIRSINWVVRVFVVIIPVAIIWFFKDRNNQPLYGFRPVQSWQPYVIMLLCMLPLIILAATQKDFQQAYPKSGVIATVPGSKWRYVLFELCYGFDFVSIEMFFRGFLILSLLSVCGTRSIIPVACFYCSIHFGKPMGEAISSFWGGLLLGIVSYYTGSILGGLFVHLGIAWLMEAAGFAARLLSW